MGTLLLLLFVGSSCIAFCVFVCIRGVWCAHYRRIPNLTLVRFRPPSPPISHPPPFHFFT